MNIKHIILQCKCHKWMCNCRKMFIYLPASICMSKTNLSVLKRFSSPASLLTQLIMSLYTLPRATMSVTVLKVDALMVKIIWPGISISPQGAAKFLILLFQSSFVVTPWNKMALKKYPKIQSKKNYQNLELLNVLETMKV